MFLILVFILFTGVNKIDAVIIKYSAVFYNHQENEPMPMKLEDELLSQFKKMMITKYPDLMDESVIAIVDGYDYFDYDNQSISDISTKEFGLNNTVITHNSDQENVNLLMQQEPNCSAYGKAMKQYLQSEKYINTMKTFAPLFANLTKDLNQNISNFKSIENLHTAFKVHMNFNLTLAYGMESVNPNVFQEAASFSKSIPTNSIELARLKVGPILKEVFSRLRQVKMSETNVKMDLYRTDDRGIVSILNALNIYPKQCPLDFATIFIELYKTDDLKKSLVKISYRNDVVVDKITPIILPNCSAIFCSLDKVTALYENIIPLNWTKECDVQVVKDDTISSKDFWILLLALYLLAAAFSAASVYLYIFLRWYRKRNVVTVENVNREDIDNIVQMVAQVTNEEPN